MPLEIREFGTLCQLVITLFLLFHENTCLPFGFTLKFTIFEPILVVERWFKQYQVHVGVKPTIDSECIEVEDVSVSQSKQCRAMVLTFPSSKDSVLSLQAHQGR